MPGFPRHTQSLGASRRKAGSHYRARPALDPDIIAAEWSEWDERHRRQSDEGRSERARAANEFQIVEDLEAALSQFAEIASDLKQ